MATLGVRMSPSFTFMYHLHCQIKMATLFLIITIKKKPDPCTLIPGSEGVSPGCSIPRGAACIADAHSGQRWKIGRCLLPGTRCSGSAACLQLGAVRTTEHPRRGWAVPYHSQGKIALPSALTVGLKPVSGPESWRS